MRGVYHIAEHDIGIESHFPAVQKLCAAYRTDGEPELTLSVPMEELEEDLRAIQAAAPEKYDPTLDTLEYSEVALVYKQLAERSPFWDMVVLHGSAIAVDGLCYVFCAKSGTGKSTHTRLWREMLGARAFMVNDDKPLIRVTERGTLIYGTPWDGKHRLSCNISVSLKAICILERGEENQIREIDMDEMLPKLLLQAYRPMNPAGTKKLMEVFDRVAENVKFYRMQCNMDISAAEMSYMTMRG